MRIGLFTAAVVLGAATSAPALGCKRRDYGRSSIVCVCNATYCDFAGDIGPLPSGADVVFESSKEGLRFVKTTVPFGEVSESEGDSTAQLVINASITYQEVLGFGGAFTDAATLNIKFLTNDLQDDILRSYYSQEGIGYTIGRIPLASCDFSQHPYSYNDSPGDFELANFTLAPEDLDLKIPYIKKAMSLSSEPIWLFGSSWSSPAWMKTTNSIVGGGFLLGEPGGPYYKSWAKYYVRSVYVTPRAQRFLQEYERRGVPIWGLTTQNEPTMAFLPGFHSQTLGFTAATLRDFVKLDLGPALAEAGYGPDKLKVMIIDDNRIVVKHWSDVILGDSEAAKYVHGVAVHWYDDNVIGPQVLDKVHESFPDKFILGTEACTGLALKPEDRVMLGSWERARSTRLIYSSFAAGSIKRQKVPQGTPLSVYKGLRAPEMALMKGGELFFYGFRDLNHWVSGWMDWNLALNTQGGPNWVNNFMDAPIIVNATAQEFYKQPMYYALGHFSKFVPRGSVRIDSSLEGDTAAPKLEYAAFKTPDSAVIVIVLNKGETKRTLNLEDGSGSGSVQKVINERSITTFTWKS